MKRRGAVSDAALPDWWHVCIVEDWAPGDPVRACLSWWRAHEDWAREHGLDQRHLARPRDPVPRSRQD